jgi:hypothetical protein
MRLTLAVLHLLAFGGLGAVFARARAANRLRQYGDCLPVVLAADSWWEVAALLWISTGLWRAFGSLEKPAPTIGRTTSSDHDYAPAHSTGDYELSVRLSSP